MSCCPISFSFSKITRSNTEFYVNGSISSTGTNCSTQYSYFSISFSIEYVVNNITYTKVLDTDLVYSNINSLPYNLSYVIPNQKLLQLTGIDFIGTQKPFKIFIYIEAFENNLFCTRTEKNATYSNYAIDKCCNLDFALKSEPFFNNSIKNWQFLGEIFQLPPLNCNNTYSHEIVYSVSFVENNLLQTKKIIAFVVNTSIFPYSTNNNISLILLQQQASNTFDWVNNSFTWHIQVKSYILSNNTKILCYESPIENVSWSPKPTPGLPCCPLIFNANTPQFIGNTNDINNYAWNISGTLSNSTPNSTSCSTNYTPLILRVYCNYQDNNNINQKVEVYSTFANSVTSLPQSLPPTTISNALLLQMTGVNFALTGKAFSLEICYEGTGPNGSKCSDCDIVNIKPPTLTNQCCNYFIESIQIRKPCNEATWKVSYYLVMEQCQFYPIGTVQLYIIINGGSPILINNAFDFLSPSGIDIPISYLFTDNGTYSIQFMYVYNNRTCYSAILPQVVAQAEDCQNCCIPTVAIRNVHKDCSNQWLLDVGGIQLHNCEHFPTNAEIYAIIGSNPPILLDNSFNFNTDTLSIINLPLPYTFVANNPYMFRIMYKFIDNNNNTKTCYGNEIEIRPIDNCICCDFEVDYVIDKPCGSNQFQLDYTFQYLPNCLHQFTSVDLYIVINGLEILINPNILNNGSGSNLPLNYVFASNTAYEIQWMYEYNGMKCYGTKSTYRYPGDACCCTFDHDGFSIYKDCNDNWKYDAYLFAYVDCEDRITGLVELYIIINNGIPILLDSNFDFTSLSSTIRKNQPIDYPFEDNTSYDIKMMYVLNGRKCYSNEWVTITGKHCCCDIRLYDDAGDAKIYICNGIAYLDYYFNLIQTECREALGIGSTFIEINGVHMDLQNGVDLRDFASRKGQGIPIDVINIIPGQTYKIRFGYVFNGRICRNTFIHTDDPQNITHGVLGELSVVATEECKECCLMQDLWTVELFIDCNNQARITYNFVIDDEICRNKLGFGNTYVEIDGELYPLKTNVDLKERYPSRDDSMFLLENLSLVPGQKYNVRLVYEYNGIKCYTSNGNIKTKEITAIKKCEDCCEFIADDLYIYKDCYDNNIVNVTFIKLKGDCLIDIYYDLFIIIDGGTPIPIGKMMFDSRDSYTIPFNFIDGVEYNIQFLYIFNNKRCFCPIQKKVAMTDCDVCCLFSKNPTLELIIDCDNNYKLDYDISILTNACNHTLGIGSLYVEIKHGSLILLNNSIDLSIGNFSDIFILKHFVLVDGQTYTIRFAYIYNGKSCYSDFFRVKAKKECGNCCPLSANIYWNTTKKEVIPQESIEIPVEWTIRHNVYTDSTESCSTKYITMTWNIYCKLPDNSVVLLYSFTYNNISLVFNTPTQTITLDHIIAKTGINFRETRESFEIFSCFEGRNEQDNSLCTNCPNGFPLHDKIIIKFDPSIKNCCPIEFAPVPFTTQGNINDNNYAWLFNGDIINLTPSQPDCITLYAPLMLTIKCTYPDINDMNNLLIVVVDTINLGTVSSLPFSIPQITILKSLLFNKTGIDFAVSNHPFTLDFCFTGTSGNKNVLCSDCDTFKVITTVPVQTECCELSLSMFINKEGDPDYKTTHAYSIYSIVDLKEPMLPNCKSIYSSMDVNVYCIYIIDNNPVSVLVKKVQLGAVSSFPQILDPIKINNSLLKTKTGIDFANTGIPFQLKVSVVGQVKGLTYSCGTSKLSAPDLYFDDGTVSDCCPVISADISKCSNNQEYICFDFNNPECNNFVFDIEIINKTNPSKYIKLEDIKFVNQKFEYCNILESLFVPSQFPLSVGGQGYDFVVKITKQDINNKRYPCKDKIIKVYYNSIGCCNYDISIPEGQISTIPYNIDNYGIDQNGFKAYVFKNKISRASNNCCPSCEGLSCKIDIWITIYDMQNNVVANKSLLDILNIESNTNCGFNLDFLISSLKIHMLTNIDVAINKYLLKLDFVYQIYSYISGPCNKKEITYIYITDPTKPGLCPSGNC